MNRQSADWGTRNAGIAHWGTLSRAERDAAYNNGAAVPGSAAVMEALRADSARVRAASPDHLDLVYDDASPRCAWDLFPAAAPGAPCLVFIHGGYWQRNSREGFAALLDGVRARGWAGALPGYRLAPDATLADIVSDIRRALDWLAERGAAHGIAGPVVLSGWSAGGHLTAMALDHPRIAAGLAISGVFELGPLRDTYLDDRLSLSDREIATLSPLRLPPVAKPLTIAYGTRELAALVEDSRALHARRAAAHCPGALLPVAGAEHFSILDALRRSDGALARHLTELL
jgi:acetyl esterase/lipase